MTNKEKKVIFTIIGVVVLILLIVVLVKSFGKGKEVAGNGIENMQNNTVENEEKYTNTLENGTKINNSQEFNEAKIFKQLEFTGMQFTSDGQDSVLLADVKNTASTTHEPEIVVITVLGDNNEVITTLEAVVPKIEPGQTKQLTTIVSADFVNARDFKIEAKQ